MKEPDYEELTFDTLPKENIIHCKECKHWIDWKTGKCCEKWYFAGTPEDGYCFKGEK